MKKRTFAMVAALLTLCSIRVNAAYELVWSDEFNCSNVNTSVWNYEIGTGDQGWGNWEQEYYSNSTNNVYTEDGSLVIKAIRDNTQYDPNYNTSFTSGRIKSNAKIQAKYGKIEASIKLPQAVKGIWPAFWMLGTGKSTWPYQGEIDIMEYMCTSSSYSDVKSTLHWNANGMNGAYSPADYGLSKTVSNPTQYHTYTMEWTPTTIRSYVDGVQYYIIDINSANFDAFQHEFYILLNLAVGGSFVNYEIDGSFQEAAMYVDWIRVYQDKSAYPASSLTDNSTECNDEPESPYDQILVYCDHSGSGKVMDLRGSNFYIWSNTVTVTSLGSTFEGANSMALSTSKALGWYGGGFTNTTSREYSFLNNYSLHFAYYTSSTEPFGVKISDVVHTINPTQTNTWVEAEIPVSSLNGITLGTSSDMLLFSICNGNGETLSDGRLIAFDDVYYYYKEPTPSISEVTVSPIGTCLGSAVNFSAAYNSFSGTPTIQYAVKKGTGSYTNISGSSYTAISAGDYTVKATATYGSESAENTSTFTIWDKPTVSISPSVSTITCTNASSLLTASGTNIASYKWDDNSTNATRTVTTGGTYTVTATSSNGCTKTASTIISENKTAPTATITPSSGQLTCNQTSITLTAGTNATNPSYAWSGTATGTNRTLIANQAGNYSVKVTNLDNGCYTNSAAANITADNSLPTVSISPSVSTITCTNTSSLLTASGSNIASYKWDDNSTNATRTVTTGGTYTVTVTSSNGCTNTASTIISENKTAPTVTITPSSGQLTCNQTSITLTAGTNATNPSYAWSGTATGTNRTLIANQAGNYSVRVTNLDNGCYTNSAAASITADNSLPTVSISPSVSTITCTNTSSLLTASGSNIASYKWNDNSTNATRTVTTGGTYTVTATSSNGCTNTASTIISENKTAPTATITPSSGQLTCNQTSITLTAGTNATNPSYAWSGTATGTNRTLIANQAGNYSVKVTNLDNGCYTNSAAASITADNSLPTVSISPSVSTITCTNASSLLTASGTNIASYKWNDNSTNATRTVTTGGTYTVTVTSSNGCTNTASTIISENKTAPTVSISPSVSTITCTNASSLLTASGTNIASYKWNDNSTNATRTVTTGGTYTVTVTSSNGCTNTASTIISENKTAPTVTIIAAATEINETQTSIKLETQSTLAISYLWNTQSIEDNITVSEEGIYSVIVSGSNGCTNSDEIEITKSKEQPTAVESTKQLAELFAKQGTITILSDDLIDVLVYSIDGRVYFDGRVQNNINIKGLSDGIYIVKINNEVHKIQVK